MSRYTVPRYAVSMSRRSLAASARRRRYVEAVATRQSQLRTIRRKRLHAAERRIMIALGQYRAIDRGSRPEISIREGFVRLPTPRASFQDISQGASGDELGVNDRYRADRATRPPAAKLLAGRSNALAFYL